MVVKSQSQRVYAVVRQSSYEDGSLSLDEQTEKVGEWCKLNGKTLVQVGREQDVSGRRSLDKRPGLSEAVRAIEDGRADVIVVAYFDRLVRSMKTQTEVLERVDAALKRRKQKGAGVVALDVGNISHETAAQWLTASFLGLVAEYLARSTGERVHVAKARAVAEGRPPMQVLVGLRKREDGTVEPDPKTRDLVVQVFEMRAATPPASLSQLADFLCDNGVDACPATVTRMLKSKQYLGELHYGEDIEANLTAWQPIIDRRLWDRVQATHAPRGRRGKTQLLLSRQGILRCGTCGARMSAGYVVHGGERVDTYRCQTRKRLCSRGAVIAAHIVDEAVLAETERVAADVLGHAALHAELDAAQAAAERAEDALSAAVDAFDGLGDVPAAKAKLDALKAARDAAVQEHEELRATVLPLETFRAEDLRGAEVADQRRAIRIALDRVTVNVGRGVERLAFAHRGKAREQALTS